MREYVARWRDQLWAEAVELHRSGGALMLPDHLSKEVRRVQDEHNLDKTDPLFPEIHRFLDFYVPEEWDRMGLDARRCWLSEGGSNMPEEPGLGRVLRDRVTVPEILQEFLGLEKTDRDYLTRSRIVGQYLNSLTGEWELVGTRRTKNYGNQKMWKRVREGTVVGVNMTTEIDLNSVVNLKDL